MKKQAVVFSGADEMAARDFSFHNRDGEWNLTVASAYSFNGSSGEHKAYIMPDVPNWHRERIQAAYRGAVEDVAREITKTKENITVHFGPVADSHLRTIKLGRPGRPRVSA